MCARTSTYPKEALLKDGSAVTIRLLERADFEMLLAFFRGLPEGDRLFLRHDVRDPALVRKWTEDMDLGRVIPIVAVLDEQIIGCGSLHLLDHGWMRHVGHIRLVTAPEQRHRGLGHVMTSELVALAADHDLEKLQAHVIEDSSGVVRMFETVGFAKEAVLRGMVKDQTGQTRNLAIMVNDVATLTRLMEDWIHQTMIPAMRTPGGGV